MSREIRAGTINCDREATMEVQSNVPSHRGCSDDPEHFGILCVKKNVRECPEERKKVSNRLCFISWHCQGPALGGKKWLS